MKFGFFTPARVDSWRVAQRAEELGFDSAWLYDSQMLYADTFACLALCAEHTSRIRLGTGVTNPVTRIAPVMASALGTINQLAPGRVSMGIGTGYSTMRAAGFPAARVEDFREYIAVVRSLIRGETASYTLNGRTQTVQMIHREGSVDPTFMNFRDPIEIHIGAFGPKSRPVAGELGDGYIMTGLPSEDDVALARSQMEPGARKAGRRAADIPITLYLPVYVMEPGETYESERLRRMIGSILQSSIGCYAAGYVPGPAAPRGTRIRDEEIPRELLPLVQRYRAIRGSETGPTSLSGEAWYVPAFEGHVWRIHPDLLDLVTEEVIRSRPALIGTGDEVAAQVRRLEALGVSAFCPMLHDSIENIQVMLGRLSADVMSRV